MRQCWGEWDEYPILRCTREMIERSSSECRWSFSLTPRSHPELNAGLKRPSSLVHGSRATKAWSRGWLFPRLIWCWYKTGSLNNIKHALITIMFLMHAVSAPESNFFLTFWSHSWMSGGRYILILNSSQSRNTTKWCNVIKYNLLE